jgi:DNA-binding NarL/FixJ family response regulator
MEPIRVIIADDHAIFRSGLKLLLKKAKRICVVAEAENGQQAIDQAALHQPHVILMDIQMPKLNGVAATRTILQQFPDIGIIALSTYNDDHFIVDMLHAGASGYLLKNTNAKELQQAIELVFMGEVFYAEPISKKLLRLVAEYGFHPGKLSGAIKLSQREIEVLQLICQEFTNKEIADRLGLSVRTVESHRERIQQKTGTRSTAGMVVYALKHHIFEPQNF